MLWGRPFTYVHHCVRLCSLFASVGLDVWSLSPWDVPLPPWPMSTYQVWLCHISSFCVQSWLRLYSTLASL